MTLIRIAVAALAIGGDFVIQRLDLTPQDDSIAIVLFVTVSLLAGLVIARWWASLIALTCLVIGATIPTGTEDTRGLLVLVVGVYPGVMQALLIAVGTAVTKLLMRVLRRHSLSPPDSD